MTRIRRIQTGMEGMKGIMVISLSSPPSLLKLSPLVSG
jgi:hypothetical protein